ncbi:MAG: general stress protein CsbD [Bacteroidetes bacterium]|nr:general stress protein CsbD [Bacteroidota bacterium]
MQLTDLKENWNDTREKLKLKFGILINSDLNLVDGKESELFGKLEMKLGRSREELLKIISEFK